MWFIGVEVDQETIACSRRSHLNAWNSLKRRVLPLLKKILDPPLIQITDESCIMIVYTQCWSQDIKENIWNAISFISHCMYKATNFLIYIYYLIKGYVRSLKKEAALSLGCTKKMVWGHFFVMLNTCLIMHNKYMK